MKYFIFGILFTEIILPLLDGIGSVILGGCEVIKGKMSVSIADSHSKVKSMGLDDDEEDRKRPIGFVCRKSKDSEDDEEDE